MTTATTIQTNKRSRTLLANAACPLPYLGIGAIQKMQKPMEPTLKANKPVCDCDKCYREWATDEIERLQWVISDQKRLISTYNEWLYNRIPSMEPN